jgi:hypothetical protein
MSTMTRVSGRTNKMTLITVQLCGEAGISSSFVVYACALVHGFALVLFCPFMCIVLSFD